ncbi:hypothetical protein [uncultured Roseobacter sp.]|uniref:hypothetical protein n=1 Tax=uncultured Roseobacter sp. TaxID=114847 RepID=UPI002608FF28|nr:hypothetical protein [uncultured Roseobacter sp.]
MDVRVVAAWMAVISIIFSMSYWAHGLASRVAALETGNTEVARVLEKASLDEIKSAGQQAIEMVNGAGVDVIARIESLESSKNDGTSVWWSTSLSLDLSSSYEIKHGLGAMPAAVVVWSSTSKFGPWDQVETTFAPAGNNVLHYGAYVADVDSEQLRLQTGNASVTSTYGGEGKEFWHWAKYFGQPRYDREKAWFRVALIGGK